MSTTQWIIGLVVVLVAGGAMGALITAVLTKYRNRRQPVTYTKEVIEIFKKNPEYPLLQASVELAGEEAGLSHEINNLSVARITIKNTGNDDIARFDFGATFKGTDRAIDVKVDTPDRHHKIDVLTKVNAMEPKEEVDFALQPFNRGDEYKLSIFFNYVDLPQPITVSTAHSTKFVETNGSNGSLEESSKERYFFLVSGVVGLTTILAVTMYFNYASSLNQAATIGRMEYSIEQLREQNEALRLRLDVLVGKKDLLEKSGPR